MALCVHCIESGNNSFCCLWRNKEVFLKEKFNLVCKKGYETGLEVGIPSIKQSSCWPLQRKACSETSLLTSISTCCGSFNRYLSSDCWWEIFVVWAESCTLRVLPFSCWGTSARWFPLKTMQAMLLSNVLVGHCCLRQLSNSVLCFQGS